jgi:hypothetical protein
VKCARARWLVVLAALVIAPPAKADGSGEKAAAEELFDQARQLMVQNRYGEACPKLVESLRLDPGVGTRLFLADCYEKSGRTASAWAEFREAAASAGQQHDGRAAVAQRRAAALESRLSRLVIVVGPDASIPGLEVRRDGVIVPAAEVGMAIPVDPGIHAVQASAAAHATWSTTVQLPTSAGSVSVTIPLLAAATSPDAPAASGAPPPATATGSAAELPATPPEAPAATSTQRTVGIAIGAAGVVGIAFGAFAGLHALSTYNAATSSGECLPDNECNAAGKQARSDASGWAAASTVAFGVGAAALVGGAVLYFTSPSGGASTSIGVAPSTAGGGAQVTVGRSW